MENKSRYKFDNPRKWLNVQREKRRLNPRCQVCGSDVKLQIHHIIPTSVDYSKVYDLANLVTLCGGHRNCHLVHGHLGNYNSHNPNILDICIFEQYHPLE